MISSSPSLRSHDLCRTAALRQKTSLFDLPDEIIELILSKCPVKSAVRFKSVSKTWQSIISNPRFSRILQSKLSENQKSKFFIWARPSRNDHFGLYLIRLEDAKLQRESELGQPFGTPLCSCDGLILLRENIDNKYKYVLWNPLIRKHIIIPAFNGSYTDGNPWHHHLYFDSLSDDYKIVFVFEKHYAVYSCKNGSWGRMKDHHCNWIGPNVYVDGCLYRMPEDYGDIICFDTRDGKLHKFRQPKEVEGLISVTLEGVSGRLCLHVYKDNGVQRLELWVMEDNGSFHKFWRKLISPEKVESDIPHRLRQLCLTWEGDVVLWTVRLRCNPTVNLEVYKKYFIYNSRDCRFQEIDDVDSILMRIFNHTRRSNFPYSENLYMPSSTRISVSNQTERS